MTTSRRRPATRPKTSTLPRNLLWPLVRASIDKDELTVIFTTGEPDDLDGAMATCASAGEAIALAQFVNQQVRYT